ncbi:MAG: hypothetical protein ACI3WQ_06330 [Faecousia sp.]
MNLYEAIERDSASQHVDITEAPTIDLASVSSAMGSDDWVTRLLWDAGPWWGRTPAKQRN